MPTEGFSRTDSLPIVSSSSLDPGVFGMLVLVSLSGGVSELLIEVVVFPCVNVVVGFP